MSKKIRALIVDDELLSRVSIRLALAVQREWQIVDECSSVTQARYALQDDALIDVVFLDIQMPEESGMVLAREISRLNAPPIVVFITAYQHYAVEAFEFHALDYLLKPFDDERFQRALARVSELLTLRCSSDYYGDALRRYVDDVATYGSSTQTPIANTICIRSIGQIETVIVDEVQCLVSSGNYVELHLANRTVLHRTTLNSLISRLDPKVFMQVHRCAMVRRDQCAKLAVTGDGTYELTTRSGDTVPVSERYVQSVRDVINGLSVS